MPLAIKDASIGPSVLTLALQVILEEFAHVKALIRPRELTDACLQTVPIQPLVYWAVYPFFDPEPILLVIFPITFVPITISQSIYGVSVRLIIQPHAFVNLAVDVNETTIAISKAVLPEPIVSAAVGPDFDAPTTSGISHSIPLALVKSCAHLSEATQA